MTDMEERKQKKKIYISIPISGKDIREQRQEADRLAAFLSREGYEPVSPFNIYAGKDPDYWDHICADLRALADCDAVYFCGGWSDSLGCSIEHSFVMNRQAKGDKLYKIIYEGFATHS